MLAGDDLRPDAVDRLLDDPGRFVAALLVGVPEWEFLPVPVRDRFLDLVGERFTSLTVDAPLAAYGLALLDGYQLCAMRDWWTLAWRDAMIERVERAVLAEMIRCGVIRYLVVPGAVAA